MAEKVSNKQWSNFSESDYSLEQWKRACLIDLGGDASTKQNFKLPVREPDGTLNSNAVHAAAGALAGARNELSAPQAQKDAAAKKLMQLYMTIGDPPPPSLMKSAHAQMNDTMRSASKNKSMSA